MARISPRLGALLSGILLIGSWIFQEYLGTQSTTKEQDISRIELALEFLAIRTDLETINSKLLDTNIKVHESGKNLAIQSRALKILESNNNTTALQEGIFNQEKWYATAVVRMAKDLALNRQSMANSYIGVLELQGFKAETSEAMKYASMQEPILDSCEQWLNQIESTPPLQPQAFLPILHEVAEISAAHAKASAVQLGRVTSEARLQQKSLESEKAKIKSLAYIFQLIAAIAFISGSILGINSQLRSDLADQATALHTKTPPQNPTPPDESAP